MRTPEQNAGPWAWTNANAVGPETSAETTTSSGQPSKDPSSLEATGMTDRPLCYPHGFRSGPDAQESGNNPARARWIEEHDVHTEFLDAGIGCCWLAEQGDHGAVMGETEDDAIAHLARVNGWELWPQA